MIQSQGTYFSCLRDPEPLQFARRQEKTRNNEIPQRPRLIPPVNNGAIAEKMRCLSIMKYTEVQILGLVCMLTSYCVWIPGIIFDMYMYQSPFGNLNKSTIGTVDFLWTNGNLFPSVAVAFFGLAVPIAKAILLVFMSDRFLPFIQSFSRWATVDAFVAVLIVTYLQALSDLGVVADLQQGFPFFVSYCIISSVAAVLMRVPVICTPPIKQHGCWAAATVSAALAQLGFLAAALAVPSVQVQTPS